MKFLIKSAAVMKLIDTPEVIRQAGSSLNRKEPGELYSVLSVTSGTREGKGR